MSKNEEKKKKKKSDNRINPKFKNKKTSPARKRRLPSSNKLGDSGPPRRVALGSRHGSRRAEERDADSTVKLSRSGRGLFYLVFFYCFKETEKGGEFRELIDPMNVRRDRSSQARPKGVKKNRGEKEGKRGKLDAKKTNDGLVIASKRKKRTHRRHRRRIAPTLARRLLDGRDSADAPLRGSQRARPRWPQRGRGHEKRRRRRKKEEREEKKSDRWG